jgi:hypothetical protein
VAEGKSGVTWHPEHPKQNEALNSMNWHCIRLSREEYQSGELDVLVGAFHAAYVASNGPAGMALFGLWSDDGQSYHVYATPMAERPLRAVLDAYLAKPEAPPRNPRSLDFICGDEEGGSVLMC